MVLRTYLRLVWVILMGWPAAPLLAQTPFDPGLTGEASRIREELQVFTDRNLYAVDEQVYFVAEHRVTGLAETVPWSSVLYVELITPDGQPLVQGKYRISGGRADGSLHIPAEAITGNYLLRAYTRWMRNTGPGSFSHIPLKVINPFKPDVAGTAEANGTAVPVERVSYSLGMLECNTGSVTYKPGQVVLLKIGGAPGLNRDQLRYCVTVVPEGTVDLESGQYLNTAVAGEQAFSIDLLPDLGNHISISGTVVGPDQEAVPFTTLHFSMLGEVPDYFAAMSDVHGKFIISTPTGEGEYKEFFVTPEQEDGSGLEVRIDQEYDNRPPVIGMEPFRLSDRERELARRIALNMQLSKAFETEDAGPSEPVRELNSEGSRIPFYGTNVKRLLIDDYVMLPNLEEVIINLIPEVQFYRKQGRNRIRILSDNSSIGVYNPLIMIDHISVFDHEALAALSPEKIERIDLINDIYLKGSVTFGGILAIHSRKGDMAGIDLPQGSYFFDYQTFHPYTPPVDPKPVLEDRVPDTRNTLLWSARESLQPDRQNELSLLAPTGKGKYVVLVRAVSPVGEVYAAYSDFTVE